MVASCHIGMAWTLLANLHHLTYSFHAISTLFSVHFKFYLMFRVVLDEKSKGEALAAGTPQVLVFLRLGCSWAEISAGILGVGRCPTSYHSFCLWLWLGHTEECEAMYYCGCSPEEWEQQAAMGQEDGAEMR